jgi:RNA polymerase-binding transcription factor DksA
MANILVIQKLTNFAQNLMDMAKSKKATIKKAAKAPAKPIAKKATKPVSKPKVVAKPAAKKSVKPASKAKAKPVVKKAAKPTPKKSVKAASKKVTPKKAVSKKVAPKKIVKAAPKKVAKPAPKKVSKSAPKKAVKKVAPKKTAPKKAVMPAPKTIVKKIAPKKIEKPSPKKVSAPVKNIAPAAKVATKSAPVSKPQPKQVEAAPAKQAAPAKIEAIAPVQHPVQKIEIKKPLFKKANSKKNSKPVETYDGKRVVRSELPAKALITIQKPEEEVIMESTHYEYPTLRYSDAELKEFKIIIDKKLEAAREELKNLKDSLDSHTESQVGNKSWNMEEGSDTSEMEYLMNQIARLNKFIRDLEMALVRIENKTYGICRATGKLIDKQRLRIVPHATLSMEAKMSRKSDDIPNTSQAPSAHMGSEGEGFGGEE